MTKNTATKKGKVYVLRDYNLYDTYKLGVTQRPINERLAEINQNPGSAIKLVYLSPEVPDYKIIEKRLHKTFANQRLVAPENPALREWFFLPDHHYVHLGLLLAHYFGQKSLAKSSLKYRLSDFNFD